MDLKEGQAVQPQPDAAGDGNAAIPTATSVPSPTPSPTSPSLVEPSPLNESEYVSQDLPEEAAGANEQAPPELSFSWQASEYVDHAKGVVWYVGLLAITAILAAVLVLFKQWTSAIVMVVMGLAVAVYSRKTPRTLTYQVDDSGMTIEGKASSYDSFRSYSVRQDVAWRTIDLEPTKRFAPTLSILCDNENFDIIEAILRAHLPRHDRQLDPIDRLSRYLRF